MFIRNNFYMLQQTNEIINFDKILRTVPVIK